MVLHAQVSFNGDSSNTSLMVAELILVSVFDLNYSISRRASKEPYTEATDEYAGTDVLLIADEHFNHVEVKHIGNKGTGYRGFAAFAFVPGQSDTLIAAIKSEEKDGIPVASYLTVFRVSDGHVLLDEEPLKGAHKFEGIAFI